MSSGESRDASRYDDALAKMHLVAERPIELIASKAQLIETKNIITDNADQLHKLISKSFFELEDRDWEHINALTLQIPRYLKGEITLELGPLQAVAMEIDEYIEKYKTTESQQYRDVGKYLQELVDLLYYHRQIESKLMQLEKIEGLDEDSGRTGDGSLSPEFN